MNRHIFAALTAFGLGLGLTTAAYAAPAKATAAPAYKTAGDLNSLQRRDSGQAVRSDWILAVVNNEPITYKELQARLLRITVQMLNSGVAVPPDAELRQQVLDKMISDRVLVQDAKEIGLTVDDASVEQALNDLATRSDLSQDQLLDRLRRDNVSIVQLRADLRDELLLEKIYEQHIQSTKVSEAEIDAYLAQQQALEGAGSYARINLAQILVAVPEGASTQQVRALEQKANDLMRQAQRGSFARIAERHSDGSREMGGAMGLRLVTEYPDLFTTVAEHLKPGQIATPVRSDAGFHILKLIDRQVPTAANTMVQTAVRHIIVRLDEGQNQDAVVADLQKLRQEILRGAIRFEDAAARYSQDGSAERGGSLGWAEPGQFVPEFESVMNNLEQGQISPVTPSRFGLHLIQVLDRRRVELDPMQQRARARQAIKQTKGDEDFRVWTEAVRARAFVEIREAPEQ